MTISRLNRITCALALALALAPTAHAGKAKSGASTAPAIMGKAEQKSRGKAYGDMSHGEKKAFQRQFERGGKFAKNTLGTQIASAHADARAKEGLWTRFSVGGQKMVYTSQGIRVGSQYLTKSGNQYVLTKRDGSTQSFHVAEVNRGLSDATKVIEATKAPNNRALLALRNTWARLRGQNVIGTVAQRQTIADAIRLTRSAVYREKSNELAKRNGTSRTVKSEPVAKSLKGIARSENARFLTQQYGNRDLKLGVQSSTGADAYLTKNGNIVFRDGQGSQSVSVSEQKTLAPRIRTTINALAAQAKRAAAKAKKASETASN